MPSGYNDFSLNIIYSTSLPIYMPIYPVFPSNTINKCSISCLSQYFHFPLNVYFLNGLILCCFHFTSLSPVSLPTGSIISALKDQKIICSLFRGSETWKIGQILSTSSCNLQYFLVVPVPTSKSNPLSHHHSMDTQSHTSL